MTATTSPAQTIDPATRRVAWAVIIGLIAPILDTTITTIALETLGRDLDVPVSTIQWVSTGYLLALAVAVPLAGWAATRFGSRVAWIAGLLIFLLGSVLPDPHIAALTATGGLMLVAIGLRLLNIKQIPVGDMLPALLVAPLLTQLVIALG